MMPKLKTIAAAIAVAATALTIAACDPETTSGHPVPATRMADAAATKFSAPTSRMPLSKPAPSPLSTNGRWKVPEQIPYGTYSVTPTSSLGGYWEQVSVIGAEPGDPGWISNDFITGPDFVTVGPDTKFMKLDDVALTPEG